MSHAAPASDSVLLDKAREWFTEGVANEVARRGHTKLVERPDVWNSQHIVMHHLSGAIPNGANLSDSDLRSRIQASAARVVGEIVGDRKGDVLVVSAYPVRISNIAGHIQYDWHAGAATPGEIQHKMAHF